MAFDISLRLPHLGLRMAEHSRRAHAMATRLAELGLPVTYPGLANHPDHALLTELANPDFGYGGILALDLGSRERAFEFMGLLQNENQFGLMAVSLGYSETLMSCSASSTSSEMPEEELEKAGHQAWPGAALDRLHRCARAALVTATIGPRANGAGRCATVRGGVDSMGSAASYWARVRQVSP